MLNEDIKYQFDFIKNADVFNIIAYNSDYRFNKSLKSLKKYIEKKNPTKLILLNKAEPVSNVNRIYKIRDFMSSFNIEYFISAAISTQLKNFLHPLVNIHFWRDVYTRLTIHQRIDNDNLIHLFNKNSFSTNFDKNQKGIFSIRKETDIRNYIDSYIQKIGFDGIYRYIKYPNKEYLIDDFKDNESVTLDKLIREYKKSYFAFILETDTSSLTINPLTEKTLIPFLTKTIPIVLGGKNFVKELEDMGFWVGNTLLGFNTDSLDKHDKNKLDNFIECVTFFNSLDIHQIDILYKENINKIENNYKILSQILFKNTESFI